ncbi:hypothetical protein [Paenibacillus sp. HJGM_3]|uniref:hypothetical protein n=1 Tax=Paenibacillus sp. HJGM_3 TaxID=3379816 RepID=UPI00385A5B51
MNLADMLCYADIQQLSSIADTYGCDCNGHSKNELIQSILSKVNRRDVFEQQLTKLSLEDIRFLNSIAFDTRDLFSLEELIARARLSNFTSVSPYGAAAGLTPAPAPASATAVTVPVPAKRSNGKKAKAAPPPPEPWNPREMITKFKRSGWLFNGYSQQTRYLFQFPSDMKRRFTETMAKQFRSELTYEDEPAVYRDEQGLFVDDIYHFLHHIYHNEVPLTADGSIYKRPLQQILDRLSVPEEPPKAVWRFGYGRRFKDLPNRFSLLYDYCYYQGLIEEQETALVLTDRGKLSVLEGRREELTQAYRFWFKLYKNPIPNLQSIVYWVEQLARDWIRADSLSKVLCPLIRPFYYDTSEAIFQERILPMMMHLGLLRIGQDEQAGAVVRMTKLGSGVVTGTYVPDEDKIALPIDNPPFPC